jgi:tetratricopeptide (TPR) repeat protein
MKRWLVPSLAGLAGGIAGFGAIFGGLTGTPTTSQFLWSAISAVIGAAIGFFTAAAGGLGIERLRQEHSGEHRAVAARERVFFLSYHTADQTWAEWIAAVVGMAGCHVVRQSWNFAAGQDLVARARESRTQTDRVIVLLSSAFMASPYSRDDWIDQLLAPGHDPLTVVKLEPCYVPGRLPVDADLAGQSAATAASLVLAAVGVPSAASILDARITRDFPGRGPTVCNLPARNENFTDRLEVLEDLHRVLLAEAGAGTSQVCVLHGLGGVGKTQTAIEFAHRFGSHYDVIWWIRAERAVGVSDHLTWLARELGIGDFPEQSRMIAALWQELRHRDRWLLIYDNARSPLALASYWPSAGTGDVLVTSRHRAWGGYGTTMPVQPFAPVEAVTFLRKRAKAADEQAAGAVAEALGCLPLALEQAAAYVEETQTSLESYRQLLAADHPGLLAAGRPQWYGETVATTWAVSIATACQEQPQARAVLAILAYLAPDDIPRDLLNQHSGVLDDPLRAVTADRVTYDLLLASLIGFSLIAADPKRISVHRLVQLTIRNQLTPAERTAFRACAVRLLVAAFPDDSSDKAAWPACGRLLPHVSGLVDSPASSELAIVLHRAGRYLHRRGDYPEARRFLERALDIRVSATGEALAADAASAAHGPSALQEAETLTALGRVYYHTAELGKARKSTERALELYRATAGEGTRPVIENTIHLSRVLREMGDFDGAERVARDLLQAAPPGPMLAAAQQVHGDALFRLGRLEEAQDAYRDALAMRHSTSADPVHLAACHKHLGIISAELGDLKTAEHELRSARALLVHDYDENNLDVIDVDNHLADILRRTGRPEEACDLLVRVIHVREELVGPHPDLAGSLTRYGAALAALGNRTAAIDALQRAQAMFADRMGADHPYVAEAGVVLATVMRDAGEPSTALDRAGHALSIYTAAYGAEHRVTRQTRALRDALQTTIDRQA